MTLNLKNSVNKLVVIEGSDGSGKTIQSSLLTRNLREEGKDTALLDFPDYESETGKLVKYMLDGGFGKDAASLNPYFTSAMYSIDRYQYIKRIYEERKYKAYDIGVCNRYTFSNLIHQGARIMDFEKLLSYRDWLYNFEFSKLGLPLPTCIIYLKIPFEVCYRNVVERADRNHTKTDINETIDYLRLVNANVERIKTTQVGDGIKFIDCYDEAAGKMRPVGEIQQDILTIVHRYIK